MTATVDRSDVEAYVGAVAALLGDLDDDEREEVLADVRQHAAEVAADTGEPVRTVLGPPDRFAAELRVAAGLAAVARVGRVGVVERSRRLGARVVAHRWVRPVAEFLPELRPAWWVVRGWLLAVVLAAVTGAGSGLDGLAPVPSVVGSRLLGLVVASALVVASVRSGRGAGQPRWRRRVGRLVAAVSVVGAWLLLAAVADAGSSTFVVAEYVEAPADLGTANLYAYLPDGTPIDEVLLYDDAGRPFELDHVGWSQAVGAEFEAIPAVDLDGRSVTNLFPREVRFFGPVVHDEIGPRVEEAPAPPPPIVAIPRLVG